MYVGAVCFDTRSDSAELEAAARERLSACRGTVSASVAVSHATLSC